MRRALALTMMVVLLASGAACSKKSSDNATDTGGATTTQSTTDDTQSSTTNTTKRTTGTTSKKGGLRMGDLGGSAGSEGFTSQEEQCIQQGAAADPILAPLIAADEEPILTSEKEALAQVLVDCVGKARIADLIINEVKDDPSVTNNVDLNCLRTELQNLSTTDQVSLLIGGSDAESIATSAALACLD
jgi:hypothetical protein